MSLDQGTAAQVLFPTLPADSYAAASRPSTAVAVAQPAPAPSTTVAVEQTHAQKMDAQDRAFGLGKYAPGPDGKTPAEAGVPPVGAASPNAVAVAEVGYLNSAGPDFNIAAPVLKELGVNLTQAQAQKLDTLRFKLSEAAMDRQAAEWATQTRAHLATPAGRNDLADAKAALKQFGSPALMSLLDASGMGNHPELLKFAAKAFRSNPLRY